jgi:hypothetical protein
VRFEKLLPLILIASLNRDLRAPSTASVLVTPWPEKDRHVLSSSSCSSGFEEASVSESLQFLQNSNGQWYDALKIGLLEGDEIIQDGFTITSEGFVPSRFRVFEDGDVLKTTKSMKTPRLTRIGIGGLDGFRLIQLLYSATATASASNDCVFYAVKFTPEANLLIRGPFTHPNENTTHALRLHHRFRNSSPEYRLNIGQTAALREP